MLGFSMAGSHLAAALLMNCGCAGGNPSYHGTFIFSPVCAPRCIRCSRGFNIFRMPSDTALATFQPFVCERAHMCGRKWVLVNVWGAGDGGRTINSMTPLHPQACLYDPTSVGGCWEPPKERNFSLLVPPRWVVNNAVLPSDAAVDT